MKSTSRRRFLGATVLAAAAPTLRALEPFARRGGPRLRLSLAAYSFRDFFRGRPNRSGNAAGASREISLEDFIDFCADHGCDGTELTSYYFPEEVTESFLLSLRRYAFLRGISISGTAVGNTFTYPAGEKRTREIDQVRRWIEYARILGAPHIRVFAGNLEGQSPADARRNCIAALEECAEIAGKAGIFLGVENHGGIVAEPDGLLEIVRAVKSRWVGINLDTGNFHTADPYADLERCAPYAVNVQVKIEIRRKNAAAPEPADYGRTVKILRDAGYQGWVALEYEGSEDPFTAVPQHLRELDAQINRTA